MTPTLVNGQFILMDPEPPSISEGDVVICEHPGQDIEMVKRVVLIEEGRFFVQGDNTKSSSDSRQFGWLTRGHIVGKVVSKF